nr:serine/threonine/dual specificity protein kinase, catalytic domain-containing protein [Tanacetum cinerariifolium]
MNLCLSDHFVNVALIIFDMRRDVANVLFILLFINYAKFFHQSISFRELKSGLHGEEFDSIAQAAKGLMSWFPGTLYEALFLKHRLNSLIDVNDCVKTSYDQMESDEPRDDNSMDYFDQKELSEEYYTKKFCKVNKEDRRDDDKLRRQLQDDCNQSRYQGNVIEQHIFPSGKLSFNRTGIIEVSFTLGSQGFSSPKGFNTCTFIAENYLNFLL